MPKCCVRGCGSKYNKQSPLISLHKLPKNEKLRTKWLEALGQEIDFSQEITFVCSLHFEESCINRTLDLVRLQDNAIPTRFPRDYLKKGRAAFSATPSNVMSIQKDNLNKVNEEQFQKTTASTSTIKDIVGDICMIYPKPIPPGMSTMTNPDRVIQKLKTKCTLYQKKIKRLNAKCRRQDKKLADLKNILQDLHKRNFISNEGIIMLEESSVKSLLC